MVEIEQIDADINGDVVGRSMDTIDPTCIPTYSMDVPDEKCIFLQEQFTNFGDSVEYLGGNRFAICLATELFHKSLVHLHNQQAFLMFDSLNIKLIGSRPARCDKYQKVAVSNQDFLFELMPGNSYGYIQLYSLPEIARCYGEVFKKNSLLSISVFHNQQSRKVAPSMITVKPPTSDRLYVPLFPGQKLQLITPTKSSIDVSSPRLTIVKESERSLRSNGPYESKVKSTIIHCQQMLVRGEIIMITNGKKSSSIWLPGIMTADDIDFYPFFNKPSPRTKTHLITHNMSGFVILDDSNPNWFCDDFAKVNLKENTGTIVSFTKPQKSVMIESSVEQTETFWWLSANKAHELDVLI